MDESNTQQLILQYAYGETDPAQDLIVRSILASNADMNNYFLEVSEMKEHLDSLFEVPHPTTVSIICEHSHDSHTEAV